MIILNLMNKLLLNYGLNGIKNIEEWTNIKTKTKEDLKLINVKKFFELRITSGSTGEPCYIYYSKNSVEAFIRRTIRSIELSNVTTDDIVLNLFAYGNYVPGSMYEKALQQMNICVIPLGAPNTYSKEKIIDVILKLKPTVWCSVPSYALGLINIIAEIDKNALPKIVMAAGEALLDSYISTFKFHGIKVVNHFGSTECPAIGVSLNDEKKIHVISDGIIIESEKNKNIEELVITDLNNFSTPILRYNSKDIIDNIKKDHNDHIIEFELKGRNDDLVKLMGILVSKIKISNTILKHTDEFYVLLKTKENRDYVEIHLPNSIKNKEVELEKDLLFIMAKKHFIYEDSIIIPKTLTNKTKYIQDLRK